MLRYAFMVIVIALTAAVLGFGGAAGAATEIARILFLVFILLFVISLMVGRGRRRGSRRRDAEPGSSNRAGTSGHYSHVGYRGRIVVRCGMAMCMPIRNPPKDSEMGKLRGSWLGRPA